MTRIVKNLINGNWTKVKNYVPVNNVLNGEVSHKVAETSKKELIPFINSMKTIPKSGLHNPFKNPERYLMLGDVCFRTAHTLHRQEVESKIINEIITVTGKTEDQAYGELSLIHI